MRITLIEPNASKYSFWREYASHIFVFKIGIAVIAAVLKKRGHEVTTYLQAFTKIDLENIVSSDIVGISVLTCTVMEGYKIAKDIKNLNPNIPIIMGGSHVTFMPDEALDYADFVIRGEGEETILEFIKHFEEKNRSFKDILGLSYWDNDQKTHNPDRSLFTDFDSLPFPDYTVTKDYHRIIKSRDFIMSMQTSRGCPFNCDFCSVIKMFGRKFRVRNIDNVIDELTILKKSTSSDMLFFVDDNLAADKERMYELLEKMLSRNITFRYIVAQVRIDIAKDEKLLKLMQKVGNWELFIGIESINPTTLETYNKAQTLEEIKEGIYKLHEYNIDPSGNFILGSDDDTLETLQSTIKFAKDMDLAHANFFILTPLPGTEIRQNLLKEQRIFTNNWEYCDGSHITFLTKNFSPYALQNIVYNGLLDFYSIKRTIKLLKHHGFLYNLKGAIPLNIMFRLSIKRNKSFIQAIKYYDSSYKSLNY